MRQDAHALKRPKIYPLDSQEEDVNSDRRFLNDNAISSIENEKAVYQRVGQYDGIAQCIDISDDGILLAVYAEGTLEDYFEYNAESDQAQKARWILSLIGTFRHFHACNVLTYDTAL